MTRAGDGGIIHPLAFGRLLRRQRLLRRMVAEGLAYSFAAARMAMIDEHTTRAVNSAARRQWFRQWWAGDGRMSL